MARSSFMWWTSNKTKPLRCSWITSTIYNGKRTQWSPVRSVITLGRNPSWRVWLQTEYDDTKFCDQLIRTISKFVIFSAFLKLKCKIFYSDNKIIPGGSRLCRVWLQTKICDIFSFFKIKTQDFLIPRIFASSGKKNQSSARVQWRVLSNYLAKGKIMEVCQHASQVNPLSIVMIIAVKVKKVVFFKSNVMLHQ